MKNAAIKTILYLSKISDRMVDRLNLSDELKVSSPCAKVTIIPALLIAIIPFNILCIASTSPWKKGIFYFNGERVAWDYKHKTIDMVDVIFFLLLFSPLLTIAATSGCLILSELFWAIVTGANPFAMQKFGHYVFVTLFFLVSTFGSSAALAFLANYRCPVKEAEDGQD